MTPPAMGAPVRLHRLCVALSSNSRRVLASVRATGFAATAPHRVIVTRNTKRPRTVMGWKTVELMGPDMRRVALVLATVGLIAATTMPDSHGHDIALGIIGGLPVRSSIPSLQPSYAAPKAYY